MHSLLDSSCVGLTLAASVSYAAYSLGPKTLRRRMLRAVSWLLCRVPFSERWAAGAMHLRGAAAAGTKSGCGACGGCAAEPPAAPDSVDTVARIPVEGIGRRQ